MLFAVFAVIAALSIPIEFVFRLRMQRAEKKLPVRLAAVGRYIEWADIEPNLHAGTGTLIIEHCAFKGPVREWWTDDDLIGLAPVTLPRSMNAPPIEEQLSPLKDYARSCALKYTDLEHRAAKLTKYPAPPPAWFSAPYTVVHLGGGWMTAILLPTGRKLAESYPNGKVVTLLAWTDEPLLFVGDAEAVFLDGASNPREGHEV